MEIPFHEEQLRFVVKVSEHRTEILNQFFSFLNLFDSKYFFLVLIPLIWLGFSWAWGLRITYLGIFNTLLNFHLKALIGWPRPNLDLPEIGMYHYTTGGLPSGAAQTAVILGGLLVYYSKFRWAKPVAAAYILLVSFSRIYLGVHYPVDILGGWAVGLVVLFLFIRFIGPLEKYLASRGLLFCFILSEAIPLALFFLMPAYFSALIGIGIGTYLSLKYRLYLAPPKSLWKGVGRGLFGVFGLALIYILWPKNFTVLALYFTVGLWVSLGASPLYQLLFARKYR